MAFLLPLLALMQLAVPQLSEWLHVGQPIDAQTTVLRYEAPADYAFAIWGVIFTLALVFCVWQLRQQHDRLVVAVSRPLAGVLATSIVWMTLAQLFGNGWWLVGLIWAMWWFSASGLWLIHKATRPLKPWHAWVTFPLFSLYTAWLSVAAWLNTSDWLRQCQWVPPFGMDNTMYACLFLTGVSAFGLFILRRLNGNIWFAVTLLWAFEAVLVQNLYYLNNMPVAMVTTGLTCVVAILAGQWAAKRQKSHRLQKATSHF